MAFGIATVLTTIGKAMLCDRVRQTPGTYTNPPKYVAVGTGATAANRTATAADTALSSEYARLAGAESLVTTTTTNDTYQNVATFTVSGSATFDEAGLFDASSSGHMFTSATFAAVGLSGGDTITVTFQVQLS